VYKTVPHITLKSIVQNTRIDPIAERYASLIGESEGNGNWEHARQLELERKREIDQIIADDAEHEVLYDQPEEERGVVRVSGPFTVEAIPPAALMLLGESPIGDAPESHACEGSEPVLLSSAPDATEDPAAFITRMISLLRQDGVTFPGNRRLSFAELRPLQAGVLHAEGDPIDDPAMERVAISFGPPNGAVSLMQVEDGIRAANLAGYDALIFAGFAFQAEAQQVITDVQHPNVRVFMSHIRPDVIMTDAHGESLLKTTADSQLFSIFGEPDVSLLSGDEATFRVRLNGVDVYDPLTGQVHSATSKRIPAWFLDSDYDGRSFAVCQAFFPDSNAWEKLQKALKGSFDEDAFDQLTSRESLPFKAGTHRRIAVKVIDQRGNEVMRVLPLDAAVSHAAD
jgi:adenine-specific DNA-methyltransferase